MKNSRKPFTENGKKMTETDKEKLAMLQAIENLLEAFKTNVRVRADGANWERENIDDFIERIKKILES